MFLFYHNSKKKQRLTDCKKWIEYAWQMLDRDWYNANIFFVYLNVFVFMFKFFSDSIRELRHVVWPTRVETKKYFIIVLSILICFWLYLFVASTLFSEILFWVKQMIHSDNVFSNTPVFDTDFTQVATGEAVDQPDIDLSE